MKINNVNQTTSFNGILRLKGSKKHTAQATKQILDKVYNAVDPNLKWKFVFLSTSPDPRLMVFATKNEVFKVRKFLSDARKVQSTYPADKLLDFYNKNIGKYIKSIPSLDAKDILKAIEDSKFDYENMAIKN